MSKRTLVAVVLTTAVIGLSSASSEAAKNFSRYYVEAQKNKAVEAPAPRPRSTTAERNRPVVPRKPIGTVLPQIMPPEDVAATEPPKRAAKPQTQASAALETKPAETSAPPPIARSETDIAPSPDIPDVAFEPPAARRKTVPPKPVAKPERLARLVPPSEAAQDVDRKAAIVVRPPIDLAPRPDVPDIPFAVPAVPSVPKADATVEAKPAEAPSAPPVARLEMDVARKPDVPDVAFEPPAAREETPPPKPVAKPERLARLVPPSEAAQDVDRKAAIVVRPSIDLAPRPDMPDIPFAVPAVPTVPQSITKPEPKVTAAARKVDAAEAPKPVARPQSQASVAVDAKPKETTPVAPAVPERLDVDMAPRPDMPNVAFAPPAKVTAEPGRQARLEPAVRQPSATSSVAPPVKIAPGAAEASIIGTESRVLPTPPRKLPHVARQVDASVPTKPNVVPQQQARVEPDAVAAEALIEPVKPQERMARPEIDMAPRPDTPDTVFVIPEIVARNAAALDSIARHTGSVTRKPKPQAEMVRSGSPAASDGSSRQDEAALDVPSKTQKAGTGAQASTSTSSAPQATAEDSACEKAKTALAGDAFTDLQAKSCTGIVFSFIGTQQGKTYSIKFGPLTGEYIAIQQASSASTGLSLDVLRGKVDEVSKTE